MHDKFDLVYRLWQTITTLFFSMFGLITLDKLEIKRPDYIDSNHGESEPLI